MDATRVRHRKILVNNQFSQSSVKEVFKFGVTTNYSGMRVEDSEEFIDQIQRHVFKMLKVLLKDCLILLESRGGKKLRIDDIKHAIEIKSCSYPFLLTGKGAYFDAKFVLDKQERKGSKIGIGKLPTRRVIIEYSQDFIDTRNLMLPEETILAFQTIIESYIFYLGQLSSEFAVASDMNTVKSRHLDYAIKILGGPSKLVNSKKILKRSAK